MRVGFLSWLPEVINTSADIGHLVIVTYSVNRHQLKNTFAFIDIAKQVELDGDY
tara:strand:- start:17 stop:178 length:162 start_codon:yes stop_codon:yes gene_type:complete